VANMLVSNGRWSPVQEVTTLREMMNQLFDENTLAPGLVRRNRGFVPALDLSETAEAYQIEVAVPGLKAADLDISFEHGRLTIKGEVKQEQTEEKRNYHRIERQYGAFTRTINLPITIRAEAIAAELNDGVLFVHVPKAEQAKPRKVAITVGNTASEAANN
jgi:HSP20 family protein